MERGKRQQVDPVPNEAERRQIKARRDYEIITQQFWPLMEKIDEWLEQHTALEGQEEIQASDVEDGATTAQAHSEGLADTIRRLLRELDGNDEASGSGQAIDQKAEVAPTDEVSGSGQAADQKPKVAPADQKLQVAPTDQKPKAATIEPKLESSSS